MPLAAHTRKPSKEASRRDKNHVLTAAKEDMEGMPQPASGRCNAQLNYDQRCGHCDRQHHLESVWRSEDKPRHVKPTAPVDHEGAVFDALCAIHTLQRPGG